MRPVPVIGAGLAGPEAAWQLAEAGVPVVLHEMRPVRPTAVHQTDHCAELVCSNSLGSRLPDRAGGVLQAELRTLGSRLLTLAEENAVPAGAALAVDREAYGAAVTAAMEAHPLIELRRGEVESLPEDPVAVIASGPLTSDALAADIERLTGAGHLSFFDALAPVVVAESLDREVIFEAARWGKGDPDYLNVPMERDDYDALIAGLLAADKHELKDFEAADPRAKQFFERCLPVEVLAARGHDALRYGPLRPVGLFDPRTDRRPWAVLQLRKEDRAGALYNLVGFQTNLRYGAQEELLRTLPGMAEAEFVRLGSMHRNTFLDAPKLLAPTLELRARPGLFFAGQITGMEGYVGNVGSGLLAGRNAARRVLGLEPEALPRTTLLGALAAHVAESPAQPFQPMKAEFGLLPPLDPPRRKAERRAAYAERSAADLATHLYHHPLAARDAAPSDHAYRL